MAIVSATLAFVPSFHTTLLKVNRDPLAFTKKTTRVEIKNFNISHMNTAVDTMYLPPPPALSIVYRIIRMRPEFCTIRANTGLTTSKSESEPILLFGILGGDLNACNTDTDIGVDLFIGLCKAMRDLNRSLWSLVVISTSGVL